MGWIIFGILAWIGCGIISYGMENAYWRHFGMSLHYLHRNKKSYRGLMWVVAIMGPFGVIVSLFGFRGITLKDWDNGVAE